MSRLCVASIIETISSMRVLTASPRRKSIASRICPAFVKSYLYGSPAHGFSFSRSGGFRIFVFSFLFCESQYTLSNAGFAAHVRELLRRHRDRHRPAFVAADRLDRTEIFHLDAVPLEHAAVDIGRHQSDNLVQPAPQPEFQIGA